MRWRRTEKFSIGTEVKTSMYKILKFGKNKTKGVRLLEEKKKYRKKNDFKINVFFNEKGEALEKVIERAFGNYCLKTVKK